MGGFGSGRYPWSSRDTVEDWRYRSFGIKDWVEWWRWRAVLGGAGLAAFGVLLLAIRRPEPVRKKT